MGKREYSSDRKADFENTLLEMMTQIPYSEITVASLIRKTGVARRTFYLYYSTKDDCLDALVDRFYRNQALYTLRYSPVPMSFEVANCTYWKENKAFLKAVGRDNLLPVLLRRHAMYLKTEETVALKRLCDPIGASDDDIIQFFVSGLLALCIAWAERDCDTPVEIMADKLKRLIRSPLVPDDRIH